MSYQTKTLAQFHVEMFELGLTAAEMQARLQSEGWTFDGSVYRRTTLNEGASTQELILG